MPIIVLSQAFRPQSIRALLPGVDKHTQGHRQPNRGTPSHYCSPCRGALVGVRHAHPPCHFHISDTSPRSFAGWVSSFKARRIIPVTLPESHKSNNLENLSPYAALFFRKTQVSVCAGDVHQRMHTSTEHTPRPSCYTKAHPRPQRSSAPEGRQSRTTASPLARDPSRRPRGVPRWDFPDVTVVRSLPVQF